ncbi:peptidylprolyl isomerase [Terriglobus albidus]|uniref:Peptidylprolyl isomerase n=1 Tax=Terriglobus albidus TaxID=1592106 RepID=A0A5B9ED59_9BACT|nr:SurA N-terminal domain-containing protein [Terriglobus albidus]QEE30002.1 peptidylprolyl isomerase [Terriglobus albidus]
MITRLHRTIAVLALAASMNAMAQQTPAPATPPKQGELLDRVVAIVNKQLILESDVNQEMRFAEIQPFRIARGGTPYEQAMNRLIDRTLVYQQALEQQLEPVTDEEVDAELEQLKKQLSECQIYKCSATENGWKEFLSQYGITEQEMREHWRQRMTVLHFIEQRFRSGASITDEQISEYYEKTLVPEVKARGGTPPPLEQISSRISEVLLQQQVSAMLQDWLKSLREQGSVRIFKDGEVAP